MWTLAVTAATVVISALSLTASIAYMTRIQEEGRIALLLASIGWLGVAAGLSVICAAILSDRRWGIAGLGLSFGYFAAMLAPPIAIVTIHIYGPLSLIMIGLAALAFLARNSEA